VRGAEFCSGRVEFGGSVAEGGGYSGHCAMMKARSTADCVRDAMLWETELSTWWGGAFAKVWLRVKHSTTIYLQYVASEGISPYKPTPAI